jgi:hypothetical protein
VASFGQDFGKKVAKIVIKAALIEEQISKNETSYSDRTFARFMEAYKLKTRDVKNIDPARIAQVTEENRYALFCRLDSVIGLVHEIDPVTCPWTCWNKVPGSKKYNMDEMGTDLTSVGAQKVS